MKVLVVGAGVAGSTCAARLIQAGLNVTVLDKARGPGGRCSTRRVEEETFDHGAAFFTARDATFRQAVGEWVEQGLAAVWGAPLMWCGPEGVLEPARPHTRFVAQPRMSSLVRHLQQDLTVRFNARVASVGRYSDGWRAELDDGTELGAFQVVLVAVPAPQAAPLLRMSPELASAAGSAEFAPCHAALVAFDEPFEPGWGGAFLHDGGTLAWVAHDASKPGRALGHRWVLHASEAWSGEHLEAGPEAVCAALLEALAERCGPLPSVRLALAHAWRFARVTTPAGQDALFDPVRQLGACGDWCRGDRLEDAYLSGAALAEQVLAARG